MSSYFRCDICNKEVTFFQSYIKIEAHGKGKDFTAICNEVCTSCHDAFRAIIQDYIPDIRIKYDKH